MAEPQSLPELLRIMDVATALRREREKASAQLNAADARAALRQRLRATADAAGEPVTDAEIDAAIAHYYRSLYRYQDPPPSLKTFVAHAWVRRVPILIVSGVIVVLASVVTWFAVSSASPFSEASRQQREAREVAERAAAEQARAEKAVAERQAVFAAIEVDHAAIVAIAKEPDVREEADAARTAAVAMNERGATTELTRVRSELAALRATLEATYELRIVDRRGERSGVDAYFTDARGTRVSGWYLIVEAVTPDGRVLEREIRDDENKRVARVRKWGEQVPKAVYDRVAADKQQDGIVDEAIFGRKERGRRGETIVIVGADGRTPIARGRRITTGL